MFTKKKTRNEKVQVTFELPGEEHAESVSLCGDFNEWSPETDPMSRNKDGVFTATVLLDPDSYHFKYLIDGHRWVNDWSADAYEPNGYGADNSVVIV